MQRRHNSPYGVTKAALEAATMIWSQDLAGTGVTCNSLIPGGRVETDPSRSAPAGRTLSPVDIMNAAAVWLASPLSDGVTGRRFVGQLWDAGLPPGEAAARAIEPPVLREPARRRGRSGDLSRSGGRCHRAPRHHADQVRTVGRIGVDVGGEIGGIDGDAVSAFGAKFALSAASIAATRNTP